MPVLPVDSNRITSGFGVRRPGIYDSTGTHGGVDYAAPMGAPIVAAADGVVEQAGYQGSYGYLVVVRHGDGTRTYYAHQQGIDVQVGQQVGAGQRIGRVGSSGNSTGPHLHFEVRVGGNRVDPQQWLNGAQVPASAMGGTSGGPVTTTNVGYRITPVATEEDFLEGDPNQVDIVAHMSRYGMVAPESRFSRVAGDMRSGESEAAAATAPADLGEVQWESSTTTGGATPSTYSPQSSNQTVQQAYDLIRAAGGTHEEARLLASVVIPESGGNPRAVNPTTVNGSNAVGLWQIMFPLHQGRAGVTSREQLFDPATNAKVALSIFRDQGLGAWEVTRLDGGRHRQYL